MADNHGFQTVTTEDHRAWLWVVSLLSLTYSILCMGARLTCKWEHLAYDDLILGLAYLFAFAHYGIIFHTLSIGLGALTTIQSSSTLASAAQYYFTSRILGFITLCLSKLCMLVFTRSIFTAGFRGEKTYFTVAYALLGVYGIASVLLSSAGCDPEKALTSKENAVCNANITRWSILTALDVTTELTIVVLPAWSISKIQVKRSKKGLVMFVFSFRLVVAGFSIAVMVNYFRYLRASQREIDLVNTVAWQEILVGFSLVSASIPCIRAFLWAFMSMGLHGIDGSYFSATGSHAASQQSRSQRPMTSQNGGDESSIRAKSSRFRPDWMDYKVDVRAVQQTKDRPSKQGKDAENQSMNSNSSEQMIIRRNMEVDVHYS